MTVSDAAGSSAFLSAMMRASYDGSGATTRTAWLTCCRASVPVFLGFVSPNGPQRELQYMRDIKGSAVTASGTRLAAHRVDP